MAKKKQKDVELMLQTLTGDYDPTYGPSYWPFVYNSRTPTFHPAWINRMLRDQRIQFGLRMIKGPILSASRFLIVEEGRDPDNPSPIKEFLVQNIDRFWRFSASKALRAIEWGYSANECLYKINNDQIHFEALKVLRPQDVNLLVKNGEKVGISVARNRKETNRSGRIYLGGPKSLWHIHGREENPLYGVSRLYGCFQPFIEMHADGGAKDVRKLYYRKYAFTGEVMYYPVGDPPTASGYANALSNKEVAQSLIEKKRTGGVMALPNVRYEDGQRKWEYIPSTGGPSAANILEYYDTLKAEIFEGMGIPNEVAEAAEVGSGWSGRKIPFEAFFYMLQEMVNWLIFDFDQQVLKPLVTLNFNVKPDYTIIPFGLLRGPGDVEEAQQDTNAGISSTERMIAQNIIPEGTEIHTRRQDQTTRKPILKEAKRGARQRFKAEQRKKGLAV